MTKKRSKAKPRTHTHSGKVVFALATAAVLLSVVLYFWAPAWNATMYTATPRAPIPTQPDIHSATTTATTTQETEVELVDVPAYQPLPEAVKAIYMSQCVVGTPSFRDDLVELIQETELNAVIIDLKDYTGKLAFHPEDPALAHAVSDQCGAYDMKEFVARLHELGIFVIGRVTVFQDPYYSRLKPELAVKFAEPAGEVWQDHKGLSFIDVGAKPFWDYIIDISREAHAIGFDEINFDYIRFPSDGPMDNILFEWAGSKEKQIALEEFFAYLHDAMKSTSTLPVGVEPPIISADLFGMVTTNYDDLNIGQILERAMPYFDYIAPMVYPSHYPSGFNGWNDPNTVPYELIKYVMDAAVERATAESTIIPHFGGEKVFEEVVVPPTSSTTATTIEQRFTGRYTKEVYDADIIRPWLQDFDYGGDYDIEEVRAQIQATYDAGLDSWMLWAPSNRYTKGALEPFYQGSLSPVATSSQSVD